MSTNFMNTYDDERVSRDETMYRRDTQVCQRPAYAQGDYGYQEYPEYAEPRYRRVQYPEARRTSPAERPAAPAGRRGMPGNFRGSFRRSSRIISTHWFVPCPMSGQTEKAGKAILISIFLMAA